jgi:hypothetical protein
MTTTTRRADWVVLAMLFVLVFTIGLFAQSRSAAVSTSPSTVARNLNSTLAELLRAAPATLIEWKRAPLRTSSDRRSQCGGKYRGPCTVIGSNG